MAEKQSNLPTLPAQPQQTNAAAAETTATPAPGAYQDVSREAFRQLHLEPPDEFGELEEIHELSHKADSIRNISVVGSHGSGKSTLVNSFTPVDYVRKPGIRFSHQPFQGISTKATYFSLPTTFKEYQQNEEGIDVKADPDHVSTLVNLIDCPGHADFSIESISALRLTDNVLVVIDIEEGMTAYTEKLILHAARERVKPVLIINKIDTMLLKNTLEDRERFYQTCLKIVNETNSIISRNSDTSVVDLRVDPVLDTVFFASAKGKWGFSLEPIAIRMAKKFATNVTKFQRRSWDNNYFDAVTKKWYRRQLVEGRTLERGFNQFIFNVILKTYTTMTECGAEDIDRALKNLSVDLTPEDRQKPRTELFEAVMQAFVPLQENLRQVIGKLSSPVDAQKYRTEHLYTGPEKDECSVAMQACDRDGPLMIYIAKTQFSDSNEFYVLGRVFSGTVIEGEKIYLNGNKYDPGRKDDHFIAAAKQMVLLTGDKFQAVPNVTPGNLVAFSTKGKWGNWAHCFTKGTITSSNMAHTIRDLIPLSPATVHYELKFEDATKLPMMTKCLKLLLRYDMGIEVPRTETGEVLITGVGETHLNSAVSALHRFFQDSIVASPPLSCYRETVGRTSSIVNLTKSPNKFNRLYFTAEPLGEDLTNAIELGRINAQDDFKTRARELVKDYNWDVVDGRKIWGFGPEKQGPNVIIDQTKGVQYLMEIKDGVLAGFEWATFEGPIAEETVRGVRFNIKDVTLFSDAIHRGGGQIIPTVRRAVYGSMLLADPMLMEPKYLVEVRTQPEHRAAVQALLEEKGAALLTPTSDTDMAIKAHMPLLGTFGLETKLNEVTARQVSCQSFFQRWDNIAGGTVLDPSSPAGTIMADIRRRKGLRTEVPQIKDFFDRL